MSVSDLFTDGSDLEEELKKRQAERQKAFAASKVGSPAMPNGDRGALSGKISTLMGYSGMATNT